MGVARRVVVIDTANKRVTATSVSSLEDMQKIVGGYIERAIILENGDEVYVNEEGLLDDSLGVFEIEGGHQPFKGNAYVIGKVTKTGNNQAARSSVDEIEQMVRFW